MNVSEIITTEILAALENGVVPWKKDWNSNDQLPVNWVSEKPYRGINLLLLRWNAQYASAKQIFEAGGRIKKGAKSKLAVFFKPLICKEGEDNLSLDESENENQIKWCVRYYRVFEIGVDTDGIERKDTLSFTAPPETNFLEKYFQAGPSLAHGYSQASYNHAEDAIRMPHINSFFDADGYSKTLYHEVIHSTGHKDRLNRDLTMERESYSKEELIAEIGSAILSRLMGVKDQKIENSASYINGWIEAIKGNSNLIISAASKAQKAVDFLIEIK